MRNPPRSQPHRPVTAIRLAGWLLCAGLLAGCAAETDLENSAQESSNPPHQNSAPSTVTIAGAPDLSQLSHHRVGLDLRPARETLAGEILIVKIHDSAGETYYLGTAGTADQLSLSLYLPREIKALWVEVFTELASAGTYNRKIQL